MLLLLEHIAHMFARRHEAWKHKKEEQEAASHLQKIVLFHNLKFWKYFSQNFEPRMFNHKKMFNKLVLSSKLDKQFLIIPRSLLNC